MLSISLKAKTPAGIFQWGSLLYKIDKAYPCKCATCTNKKTYHLPQNIVVGTGLAFTERNAKPTRRGGRQVVGRFLQKWKAGWLKASNSQQFSCINIRL